MLQYIILNLCSLSLISIPIYFFYQLCLSPLSSKDWKWTKIIWKTRKNWIKIDNEYFYTKYKNKDYIITFHDSWLFEIYEGKTKKEIWNKYCLGGQSNKADYLKFYQLHLGDKIEKYYLNIINNEKI